MIILPIAGARFLKGEEELMMDFTKMSLEEIGAEINRINHIDHWTFEDRARKAMLDAEYARRKAVAADENYSHLARA